MEIDNATAKAKWALKYRINTPLKNFGKTPVCAVVSSITCHITGPLEHRRREDVNSEKTECSARKGFQKFEERAELEEKMSRH
jgi:hypothetical protein